MASLPSNTFMFNYNAKEYDAVTHTFPKTQGQLYDYDITLNKAPASYTDEYVDFGSSQAYTATTIYNSNTNPFNRSVTCGLSLTIVYKTSGFTNDAYDNIMANRSNNYNWMARADAFHTASMMLLLTATTHPEICVVRVNADGSCVRRFMDSGGTVLQEVTASSISYGGLSNNFAFFAGYANGGEYFNKKFYWMYCSMEALTDEEINQVIRYNETLGLFEVSPTALTYTYTGGSQNLTVTSNSNWTASTSNEWISISPLTGTSADTTIAVSVGLNKGDGRTGTITVTDGESTQEVTISQDKHPVLIPIMKMYRNGDRIN